MSIPVFGLVIAAWVFGLVCLLLLVLLVFAAALSRAAAIGDEDLERFAAERRRSR